MTSGIFGQRIVEQTSPKAGTVNPYKVRFTQNSIKSTFKNGTSINELSAGLKNGNIDPKSVTPIRVYMKDSQLYSLDNRRLQAFRQAKTDIPYQMATQKEIQNEAWKFTTTNNGKSIKIRN